MGSEQVERRLAAILFSDVEGYTAAMAESEALGLELRERHRQLIRELVPDHDGELVEARGDESLSIFPTALAAVRCAQAIQRRAQADPDLSLHLGVHLGDVVFRGGEVSGDGVNVAARLCALSEGGRICVSGEVYQAVRNQPDLHAVSLGERELENVGRPVAVWALESAGTEEPSASEPSSWRGPLTLGVSVAAGLLFAVGIPVWSSLTRGPPDASPPRSIAVLPLENLSGDADQEYFADGMTEALIADLGRIRDLRVISRTSAMRYKNSELLLREIAGELGVEAVIEGSVFRAGDDVRITTQLVDARSDGHIWSGSYTGELANVLALQAEVAGAVARSVEVEIGQEQRTRRSRKVNPRAYEAYLRSRQYWASDTKEDYRRAIRYLEAALEHEPDYAEAYAGLASTYT